ncbi:MarR family winged helix-turn-helix transcriptional regulator [Cryptosporangium minutisporangium]|uniref:HTH marR-type domain-containing protein n=1 Tax=Cryptosporangium minutisporangium TaxID=113569 RepID=A0ABP6T2U4_9ACTN
MNNPEPSGRNTTALLYQAYLRLAAVINDAMHEFDPRTRPAYAAVLINMDLDGIRLTRLAEKAQMTPQAMGELVDSLERLGYLQRLPDPADRRAKLIQFTEAGRTALETAFEVVAEIETYLAETLGRDTLDGLHTALDRILGDPATSDGLTGLRHSRATR